MAVSFTIFDNIRKNSSNFLAINYYTIFQIDDEQYL